MGFQSKVPELKIAVDYPPLVFAHFDSYSRADGGIYLTANSKHPSARGVQFFFPEPYARMICEALGLGPDQQPE